jgi:uncharacterized protein (TIGR02391 family)
MKNQRKKIPSLKKRGGKKQTTKKRKTITAPQAQAIRGLAEQIGKLIALEGFRSSFSLTSIAKKKGLFKYLPKKSINKKEAFFEFLKNLHCYKPRTIKILVREILPVAIEKRHAKGDPVLEAEALELSNKLKMVGINLRSEILALNLPKERPKTVPPPIAVQKILDTFSLHPILLPDCKDMFINGHINESVRKALERYEKLVQDLSGVHNKQGSDLMAHVFNEQTPKVKLNALNSPQEINKQIGYKFVAMGIMHWWRNNLSHGDEEQIPHYDALGRLILITNLIHELDRRVK